MTTEPSSPSSHRRGARYTRPAVCTPHARQFRSFGSSFAVAASSPALLTQMANALPPLCTSSPAAAKSVFRLRAPGPCLCGVVHTAFELFHGRRRVQHASSEADALDDVRAAVKLWVGANARQHVFVHAGVVGWNGRAVVLPGGRGVGKTTLVHAFLQRGATYFSDDMAIVDVHGRVHPYPLLLSVRAHDADLSESRTPHLAVDPATLGARTATQALPVAAVVFARLLRPQSDVFPRGWVPETLSPGNTVLKLMSHVVGVRRRPAFTLDALHAMVRTATVRLEGTRTEFESVLTDVCDRLAAT